MVKSDAGRAKELQRYLHPFGAGSRSCLGIHLAYMELRLAVAEFFLAFPAAGIPPACIPNSDDDMGAMEMENFFLVAPKGHSCEINLSLAQSS